MKRKLGDLPKYDKILRTPFGALDRWFTYGSQSKNEANFMQLHATSYMTRPRRIKPSWLFNKGTNISIEYSVWLLHDIVDYCGSSSWHISDRSFWSEDWVLSLLTCMTGLFSRSMLDRCLDSNTDDHQSKGWCSKTYSATKPVFLRCGSGHS